MDFSTSEILGYIGTAFGAIFIFYKEIYKKNQDSKLQNKRALTEADIERRKHKDRLDSDTKKTTLEAYTELNNNVFDLFKSYLSDMRKDSVETKAEVNMIKNFCDSFDRQLDEIYNKVSEIDIRLDSSEIKRKPESNKEK